MESIFFHIDVNSAFLSWTAIDQLQKAKETDTLDSYVDLRDIPSIIGGDSATRHGIVLAKSIPAKKYGISTAEPIASALKKCPSLVIASPDHHSYSAHSLSLIHISARNLCRLLSHMLHGSLDPVPSRHPESHQKLHHILYQDVLP